MNQGYCCLFAHSSTRDVRRFHSVAAVSALFCCLFAQKWQIGQSSGGSSAVVTTNADVLVGRFHTALASPRVSFFKMNDSELNA